MARRPITIPLPSATPPAPASADVPALWAMARQGQTALATQGLIRLLTARGDDPAALLAVYLLQLQPVPAVAARGNTATGNTETGPTAPGDKGLGDGENAKMFSASIAELVALVRTQDDQIAALLALIPQ